jgi:hypothetical protein
VNRLAADPIDNAQVLANAPQRLDALEPETAAEAVSGVPVTRGAPPPSLCTEWPLFRSKAPIRAARIARIVWVGPNTAKLVLDTGPAFVLARSVMAPARPGGYLVEMPSGRLEVRDRAEFEAEYVNVAETGDLSPIPATSR